MDNLKRARMYMLWLERVNKEKNQDHYATLVTAYSALAIAEKMYEENGFPRGLIFAGDVQEKFWRARYEKTP